MDSSATTALLPTPAVVVGPSLDFTGAILGVATAGDFVAISGCTGGATPSTCFTEVVQISVKKKWIVPSRAGKVLRRILVVEPTEMLLADDDYPLAPFHEQALEHFVRVDFSKLDTISSSGFGP
jgi:hypothetical protein